MPIDFHCLCSHNTLRRESNVVQRYCDAIFNFRGCVHKQIQIIHHLLDFNTFLLANTQQFHGIHHTVKENRVFGCRTESFSLSKEQLIVTGREMSDAQREIIRSVVENSNNPIVTHCKESVRSVLGCIRAQELPRVESRTEQDSCKFAFILLRGY